MSWINELSELLDRGSFEVTFTGWQAELRKAIADSGLEDLEIAQRLKVSGPTVSRWRSGKGAPHKYAIRKVLTDVRGLK